jgi:hypothetical protein
MRMAILIQKLQIIDLGHADLVYIDAAGLSSYDLNCSWGEG